MRLRLYPRLSVKCIVRVPRHREPRMIDIGQSSASQGSEAAVAIIAEGVVMVIVVVRCVCVCGCALKVLCVCAPPQRTTDDRHWPIIRFAG